MRRPLHKEFNPRLVPPTIFRAHFPLPLVRLSPQGGATGARTRIPSPMNILLWVLQGLAVLLYGASGVMKVFLFERVSKDVPSFGALPREAWRVLGLLELACSAALILPAVLSWRPALTGVAAAVLAIESLVFLGVHAKYREVPAFVMSAVLGLLMAFLAYGRLVLVPVP